MPVRRTRAPFRRRGKKTGGRRLRIYRGVKRMFNPNPVFTETANIGTWGANTGGIQTFNISQVPQIAQYSNLYQKYRILKATLIIVPHYASTQDQNAAQYNLSVGLSQFGLGRLVMAVNDSPSVVAPTAENDVLQDNGCKISAVKHVNRISCVPVPNLLDSNFNVMTVKKKYLNFNASNPNPAHYGISYWYSQPLTGTPTVQNLLNVYVKLTFQLSDPR